MTNWIAAPVYGVVKELGDFVQDALAQDVPGGMRLLLWHNGTAADQNVYPEDSRISIVRSSDNIGVGPAWNRICQFIFGGMLGERAEHLLMCNDDIRMRPDTYRNLLVPNGGFVSPVNVGDWEKAKTADFHVTPEPIMRGGPDFSCFVLKKWFFERVGPFAECYFPAYHEDRDYHMMAISKGLEKEIYSVQFPYFHAASQTIKQNPEVAALNSENWAKNRQTFIDRWGGEPHRETHKWLYGRGDNLKVGFDLDGTAWKFRAPLRELAHGLKLRGHQVGIITGHDDSIREADLRLWEARGYPKADFLLNASDREREGISDHGQRQWKGELCKRHGVTLHIDDWGTNDRLECWVNAPDETEL